jgi:hypothetical protein
MTETEGFKQPWLWRRRLAAQAERLKEQAKKLPSGEQRDEIERKVRQMETASHINEWLTSPGLLPPK